MLASALLSACAQTLVDRAIEARGGPLDSYQKESDAEVLQGIPGSWRWELAYRIPASFRWSIATWGDEQTIAFDGTTLRRRLGSAELPATPATEPVKSQARWLAVTALQILEDPRTSWRELPREELRGDATHALSALWLDDETRSYQLFFDDRYLLVRAIGDVSLPPIGSGQLEVTFSDFRDVQGYLLPFAANYQLDGKPLLIERVRRWVPNAPVRF